jgi:integrase
LTHLAVEGNVAASTQNQARSALLFLYKEVLGSELPWLNNVEQARKPRRLPVVLTEDEVRDVLANLEGVHWLVAALLYGAGLRLMEALRLRVQDVDFKRREVLVRNGKGFKDRVTMLPDKLAGRLQSHLATVRFLHEKDLAEGFGEVHLPYALDRKYPNAGTTWGWQYVFLPAIVRSTRALARRGGIIWMSKRSSEPSSRQCARPGWSSRLRRTPCAILLRHTCCRRARISARCRSCWATRMYKQP